MKDAFVLVGDRPSLVTGAKGSCHLDWESCKSVSIETEGHVAEGLTYQSFALLSLDLRENVTALINDGATHNHFLMAGNIHHQRDMMVHNYLAILYLLSNV